MACAYVLKQLEQTYLISIVSLCRLLLTLSYVDVGVDVIASVVGGFMGNIGGCEDVEVCLYESRCEFTVRGSVEHVICCQ